MKYKNKIRSALALLLIGAIFLAPTSVAANGGERGKEVILGGMPFGVSFCVGELRVKGFDDIETENGPCSPARDAGVQCEDIICKINEKEPTCALDLTKEVRSSNGEAVKLTLKREDKSLTVTVKPALSVKTGEYRIGLWLDDSAAGLGTVTYIEKGTKRFGGLGHGICETASGELSRLGKGVVSQVEITGVTKGEKGQPGELRGDFLCERLGSVIKNTNVGVFGLLTKLPCNEEVRTVEVGSADTVKDGGASVFCTTDKNGVCEYGVELTLLEGEDTGEKSFLIRVTDTALLKKTGGIVRGMSGSPIIQDGKLVGAVTHVLVNDPTRGYGIFIENMLIAAA